MQKIKSLCYNLLYKLKNKYEQYYFWHISPIEGLHNLQKQQITYGEKCRILGPVIIRKAPESSIVIGDNFFCQSGSRASIDVQASSKIQTEEGGCLKIGDNVGVSSIVIHCWNKIVIGNNVKIGAGCMIFDTNFHNIDFRIRTTTDAIDTISTRPVYIDDNVFIGTRSIICKGVHIGKNSIVAAGSVVVKDIPENEVWGGNPAKFIKSL